MLRAAAARRASRLLQLPPACCAAVERCPLSVPEHAWPAEGRRHLAERSLSSRDWAWLKERGVQLNPCNSPLHPAVLAGAIDVLQGQEAVSIQEAYTPHSTCFGCGPESEGGLQLRSMRSKDGLSASVRLPRMFQAFPGIITGGIVSTLFDCHGNWTAAVALMDQGRLSKPPLTLTKEMLVQFLEPTPPEEDLILVSTVTSVEEYRDDPSRRDAVQVDLQLLQVDSGPDGAQRERVFARGTGRFKKLGALRAM